MKTIFLSLLAVTALSLTGCSHFGHGGCCEQQKTAHHGGCKSDCKDHCKGDCKPGECKCPDCKTADCDLPGKDATKAPPTEVKK